jgi:ZU5 domain
MSGHRMVRYLALSVGALVGLACGDYTHPTSPVSAKVLSPTLAVGASYSFLASSAKAKAVRWGYGHSRVEQAVSAVIGPDGGTLSLPGSDFSMSIPSGALTKPVTITVVSKAGRYVAYEMLPHGLMFLRPATAAQGLKTTSAYGTDAGDAVRSAYLPEGSETIDADDSASPSELEASTTYFSGARPVAESHVWVVNHFSRYILISGVWVCADNCSL